MILKSLKLLTSEISDRFLRENFYRIENFAQAQPLLAGHFQFFSLTLTKDTPSGQSTRIPHGLGFQPKDVIQSSAIGSGSVSWNYDKFDSAYLDLTATGISPTSPLTIRAFIGSYEESSPA